MNINTPAPLAGGESPVPEALLASGLSGPAEVPLKQNELGQDEFLKLMLTQIEHQDPLKPMENGEFIGQMAQFSTVSGIEGMQASLDTMAASFGQQQTLQAAELVGAEVLVEGDTLLAGDGASQRGRFELDAPATAVSLSVHAPNGELIARRALGSLPEGRHDFSWDGTDDDGDTAPPGGYRVTLTADNGTQQQTLTSHVARRVESVEFGAGGTALLNARGGDTLTLADVREIREAPGTP